MIGKNIPEKIKKFEEAVADHNFNEARRLLLENEVVRNQAPTRSLIFLMNRALDRRENLKNPSEIIDLVLKIDRVRKEIAKDLEMLVHANSHPAVMRLLLEKIPHVVPNIAIRNNIDLALREAVRTGNQSNVTLLLNYFKGKSFGVRISPIWASEEEFFNLDFTSIFKDSTNPLVLAAYRDFATQTLAEQSYAMAKTMSEKGLPKELISISCQYQNSFDLLSEQESQQAIAAGIKRAIGEIQRAKEQDKEKLERIAREKAERESRDAKEKHAKEKQKKAIQEDYDYAYAISLSNGRSGAQNGVQEKLDFDFAYAISLSDKSDKKSRRKR